MTLTSANPANTGGRGSIRAIAFRPDELVDRTLDDPGEIAELRSRFGVTWIDLDGIENADRVRSVAERFGLHPLAIEDTLNVRQRAKVEPYTDHTYIVMRMPCGLTGGTEQLNLFVGPGWVLTIQGPRPGDSFERVRTQLHRGHPFLRLGPADRLAYALIDAVIDAYFPMLERLGDQLEQLESRILDARAPNHLGRMRTIKRHLRSLRRAVWPIRDAVNVLLRDPVPGISEETRVWIRDCYDHTARIIDLIETQREMVSDLTDLHLSMVNNRMNEVMKVLTIWTVMFVPLNLIAGVYGMNFEHMPETKIRWAYPLTLVTMASVATGLFLYFRWRGWIGRTDREPARPSGR
jgi:magnesium transporter